MFNLFDQQKKFNPYIYTKKAKNDGKYVCCSAAQ